MTELKFDSASEVVPEFNNYARALRAIGQDLTKIHPETLEIQVTGTEFVASGVGITQPNLEHAKHTHAAQTAWNRLTGKGSKVGLAATPGQQQTFTRKYTLETINRLDEIGLTARKGEDGKPDIYSLGERLRTVGRIVDGCQGTLIRIVKDNYAMTFEYRDVDGIVHEERYTNLALYKYQQRYYAERGTHISIDPWHHPVD